MEKENKKTIDDLAIELFDIYSNSERVQPFNAGVSYANHNNHFKYITNMKSVSKAFKIESLYFDPKDMRDEFEVYWHQYKGHEIKNGELRVDLISGHKRSFSLE